MFNVSEKSILDITRNIETFSKGKQYYMNNRVKVLEFNDKKTEFNGTVTGSNNYKIKINFLSEGDFDDASCTCPAYRKYWGYCKHIVAGLFEIQRRDKKGEFDYLKSAKLSKELLDFFRYKQSEIKIPIEIEFTYEYELVSYNFMEPEAFLSMRMGEKKLYIVKNIRQFFEKLEAHQSIPFGKDFTFDPERHTFKESDLPLIDFLKEVYENEKVMNEFSYGHGSKSLLKGKRMLLTDHAAKRFFSLIQGRKINAIIKNETCKDVIVIEKDVPIEFTLMKEEKDLLLKIHFESKSIPLTEDGEYYFIENNICRISKKQRENLQPFYKAFSQVKSNAIKIPQEFREGFVSEVYPFMKQIGKIELAEEVQSAIYTPTIKPEVYLDRDEKKVIADVKFIYGDITINPFERYEPQKHQEERILVREIEKEREVLSILEESDFKVKNNQVYLEKEEKVFDFIADNIGKLQKAADVYYSESFKNIKLKDGASFTGALRLNGETDMLEFHFEVEGISNHELAEVFQSLKEKKKYYRLKDGSFLSLNHEELLSIKKIFEYLDLDNNNFENDVIELPKFRALYMDDHLKLGGLSGIKRNLLFKEFVQNIKEPGDIEYRIPDEIENILRDYQRFGFKWLKTLASYGLGGILADDMGLGKTLQVLTFLLAEKREKGAYPSLIVAPTSLVYNWAAEIEKFTPDLNVLLISGNKNERQETIEQIMDYDVVVTSYPLIRRDIELYDNFSFRYCILDEAQHIKNRMSQNAKSVKHIKAKNYFALTGTPIENSLIELWSIFDFIMPSYLLSHAKFTDKFERPIIKDQDKEALEALGKHIRPFILRRLKKDVLKELPEKIEHTMISELSVEQKKIYLAYLKQIKGEIEEEINNKGFEKSQIKILAALTRLRQICCHPSLFVEHYKGESGKLLLLEEIIRDAIDSGHRILLFSQFTSMLAIIRELLNQMAINYQYLDGATDIRERGMLVKDFNNGKGEVFLISLKAGGTGLNLTGADTVIHFDPWWNPAVEEQATDRAYRIGQKNSVHVMKLITKGTIEEKIYALQEKKRKMIDAVIQPGETLVSKMTEKEVKELFEL